MTGPSGAGQGRLLGRELELEAIERALSSAAEGRGVLLLVVGEPGIGKTSLADAFESRARGRGFAVHWGRASETGGAPAYWPWTQVLSDIAAAETLGELARPGAPLAPILAADAAAPVGDAAQARFRLFEGTTALLRAAAKQAPLALVLDDVHATDPSSLELLHFVARALRGLPVALLATYRDVEARQTPATRDVLSRIAREGTVLPLRRLSPDEIAALVQERLAGVSPATLDAVQRVTEGNPLFVGEVVRQLAVDPTRLPGADLERLPVTDGVRVVIGDRLALLATSAREVLDAAAVLGREVHGGVLTAMVGRPFADVRRELDALAAADVLDDRGAERFVFRHVLFREVPYRDLTEDRRAALHLAAADATRASAAPDATRLAEVAHHVLAARAAAPAALIARAVLDVAEHAIRMLAHEEAVRWTDRGLEALAALPGCEALRGSLLVAQAEALAHLGEIGRAKAVARQAAELARAQGDVELACRAALAYGQAFEPGIVDPARVELLSEALAAIGPAESALRARLLARLAAALQPSKTPEEPIAMALEAVAMARRAGDPAALLPVLRSAASAMADTADPAERMPIDSELAALAAQRGDPVLELQARMFLFLDHLEAGDAALARLRLDECERLANRLEHARYRWRIPLLHGELALLEGRFADAERLRAEARRLTSDVADPFALVTPALQELEQLALQGRFDEEAAALPVAFARMPSMDRDSAIASAMLAQIAARAGDLAATRARLALLPPVAFDIGDPTLTCLLAEAVAVAGHDSAAELYARVLPLRRRLITFGLIGSFMDMPGSALLARLALAMGRGEEAVALLEEALGMVTSMRAAALETWIRLWLGEALAAQGLVARAREELERAALLAATLGIRTVPERVQRAFDASAAAPLAPPPSPPTAVSPPASGGAPALSFTLARTGDTWTVARAGREVHLKDLRGLQILARLVAEPGRELHCTELAAAEAGPSDLGDAGELLDREAKEAYRRRLEDLREDLEEAEGHNDRGRAERIQSEIEALTRELSRAVGLGGRDRRAGAAAERARTAVQRRVREAVRRIAEHDPELGRHLDRAVRTGAFCVYDPEGRG